MADALLSASLRVLFQRLASPELINFIRRRNLSVVLLDELERKLVVVLNVLDDAEVKQFSNSNVKKWLVNVKGAVYDAEDLLDEIATDALRCKMEAADSQTGGTLKAWKWNKFSASVKTPFAIKSMESRVRGMIDRLGEIVQEKVGLGLAEGGGEKRSPIPGPLTPTSLEGDSIVVGRDEIKKEMVEWLLSDNTTGGKMGVMSIVGMGGSGKTTLARLLYNEVKEHFDLKAWVCVSTEFFLIKVTKKILRGIGSKTDSDDLNKLQLELRDQLSNKKFLLVLDDVWNLKPRDEGCMVLSDRDGWESLRTPLLAAAEGSKIVVTSRDQSVATTMRAVPTHHLGKLSSNDSWSLFKKHAFGDRDPNAFLEPIGRQIVDKCKGLPLAVKALGCLLHSKVEKREWNAVLESEIWQSDSEILPSLRLSYHHLSPPLKHCFAYCSIFPQDHQFNKEKLILLWMAEGLLQNEGRRMEEIGESYFDELLAKSFFQKSVGRKRSCFVMHDLIHELAQNVSGDFCARVEDDEKLPPVSEKARHFLYFNSDDKAKSRLGAFKNFEAVAKAKSLRTCLGVNPWEVGPSYTLSKRVLQDILPKMWCLRVLSLCGCAITDLPKSIGNLKHLRYLDLSFTGIKKLPESVCCLCNLQTLILRKCSSLDELPSKMGKLINLRYLDIDGCNSLREMSSHGIGRLKNLQRLTQFNVGQNNGLRIGELGELSEIRGKLHISNMENVVNVVNASRANMKDKSYLDELIFDWCTNGVTQSGATTRDILNKLQPHRNLEQLSIRNYPGEGFPNWLGDPSVLNLVSLELRGCGNCSTLPPLGQLTQLKYLQISGMNGVECVGDEFYGNASFQFLETLSFEDMPNWEKWLCCGEFPRLQKLFIRKCPKLTGKLPEQLLSLVELQIDGCPQLLMASLTVPAIRQLRMVDFGKLRLQMTGCDFTALQTSEIEILDVSQWSQLPMAPHRLSIKNCDYVESLLEEEISQTNIHDLRIYDCSFSGSLHKVGLPTTLKSLFISDCSKLAFLLELFRCHLPVLESLEIKDGVIDDSLSLSFSLGIFPKLTNFTILNLKGLEKLSILVSEGDPTSLCSLSLDGCPNLESIELHALNLESCSIYRCSKLRSLAHAHSSVQELNLGSCPELLFQREGLPSNLRKLGITDFTPQVEWGLQKLTSLTHFTIEGGCEDIELVPKECLLPSSLTSLQIVELSNLKSLDSRGLQQLTSLLQLKIGYCPELQFSTGSVLQHLISLKRLEIDGCSRLQSLTEVGLQHLTSLEMLSIENCPMLQSLTKVGLQHLTSLKTLAIYNCRKLKYLTKERLPDSLSYLDIYKCRLLEKRCQFEKGEEWRYIAHIPNIEINHVLY